MTIPINIWDDFYDDGYVPQGKTQNTYIYVEEPDIPLEKQEAILQILLEHLKTNVRLEGVTLNLFFNDTSLKYPQFIGTENEWMLFKRWEIRVDNLTHKRLDSLVGELNNAHLDYEGVPFRIYSES